MIGKTQSQSKTVWVAGLTAVLGLLEFANTLPVITQNPQAVGVVTMAIAAAMYVLRRLTTEPLVKRSKRSPIRVAPRDPERNDPRKP